MRSLRVITASLLAILMSGVLVLLIAPAASAQADPCPPGQPGGRPPGQPPNNPGKPDGRPPEYPPGRCNLQLSKGSAARGESITATGAGFTPGEAVVLSLGSQRVASVTADPLGNFTTDFTVPNDAAFGRTSVQATGAASNTTLSAAFEVLTPAAADRGRATAPAAAGASVARTGAYIAGITAVGLVLVALGTVFVTAARRRRNPLVA